MRTRSLLQVATALWMAGCAQGLIDQGIGDDSQDPQIASTPKHDPGRTHQGHIMPLRGPTSPRLTADRAHLNYYGGHVVANAKVVPVFWGPNVAPATQMGINGFFSSVLNSPYMDWLSEYNTHISGVNGHPGTNQDIGRGTAQPNATITPTHGSSTVTDDDIRAELAAQLDAGRLPAPDADTIYMFYFAPGVTIDLGGSRSCVVFCAYHNTDTYHGQSIFYGVHPDMGGGCAFGCGGGSQFQNLTSVSSHELIETVTDAEIGLVTGASIDYPAAWYDPTPGNDEIGDICNGQQATVAGYTVQKQWSNNQHGCVSGPGGGGGDTTPPVVTFTGIASGATVSGTVHVSASATDPDDAVSLIEIVLDGATVIATANGAMTAADWDSTRVGDGAHTIVTNATDTHGNVGHSAAVSFTVHNGGGGGGNEMEPNDDRAHANAVSAPGTITGFINPAGDSDVFAVQLPVGRTLTVDLTVPATSDFDLYVYNSIGQLIAYSENDVGLPEHIAVTNRGTMTLTRYVRVLYYSGASAVNPYHLRLNW